MSDGFDAKRECGDDAFDALVTQIDNGSEPRRRGHGSTKFGK